MAEHQNRVHLIGEVYKAPQLYDYNNNRKAYAVLSISDSHILRKKSFIGIEAWNDKADELMQMPLGSTIEVKGAISTGSYEKNGQKVFTTAVTAYSVMLLEMPTEVSADDAPW